MDWKRWVNDFLHGRTHVLYGMIIAFVMSLYMMSVFYGRDLSGFVVALVLAFIILASATDLVAHLYYHISFVASSTVLLMLMRTYLCAHGMAFFV